MEMTPQVKEAIKQESKRIKRMLYTEEFTSFLMACFFGINLALVLAGSPFFLVNLLIMYWLGGHFRGTVRKQEAFHLMLNHIKNVESGKAGWTTSE